MALPTPNLDDRRFQNLVDEAKRLVMQRCPEWSDHNVSDPGVTLIETFAYMTDLLLYRLNRVPDRNYIRFLDLIGVKLFPPTAASTKVTFWLAAAPEATVTVLGGAEVAVERSDAGTPAITFTTADDLAMPPCSMSYIASIPTGGTWRNHTDSVSLAPFACFSPQPVPGEVLLIGLSTAVPRCAVDIRFDCDLEGHGVRPEDPPLVWEAFDGTNWQECEVDSDSTGGLNRRGDVVIHVPDSHEVAPVHGLRAGWVRARLTPPEEGQPFYSHSPLIKSVAAYTAGGTVIASHAEVIRDEVLGICEGVAGQSFQLLRPPVVPSDEALVVEVAEGDGWEPWSEVTTFAESGASDQHFSLDDTTGELRFGPIVRNPDGTTTNYGAVPEKGAIVRIREYRTGGGQQGNVARGTIRVMRTSVPGVSRVENRKPATGGVDGETVDEARVRGPIVLRTIGRAVTAEDYEQLAREAAPEAARIRAVPATGPGEAGGVRVLVVPSVAEGADGRLSFAQLVPDPRVLAAIADSLDRKRTIGARIVVEPPLYQGVTVVAMMRARPWADPSRLELTATEAIYEYLHPIRGGREGRGWPFGRPVLLGEVFALLQGLPGVEIVEDVRLFSANPRTGVRGEPSLRVDVAANALVFSYEHQVRVEAGG